MTGDPAYDSKKIALKIILEHDVKRFSTVDPVILENSTDLLLTYVNYIHSYLNLACLFHF